MLTQNKIRQHNLQIINDARQNKAGVKITPTAGAASADAAQVFEGLIRRIEYQSMANDAYSTAFYHQVESGLGFVTVETKYVDEQSGFEQELFVGRVADPDTIYYDPDCVEYDKSDMMYAFEFVHVPRETWDENHPKNQTPPAAALDYTSDWVTKDHVRVAKFWRRVERKDRLHLLTNGVTVRDSELQDDRRKALAPLVDRTREVIDYDVEWFRIEGDDIVEEGKWAGKFIPIAPCIGEETLIDGVLDRKGHTRSQIDAQRVYNYWSSSAVEQVALQSKTPYVAAAKAIEGHEGLWNTANIKNHSVLIYNGVDDDGKDIAPPQRQEPPTMGQAYLQGMQMARQDLLDVTGQYQAELGMPSNERSGTAIQARQRQGDTATYHYIDNQAKMIRHVGRILLDLIPKVYDTTRIHKIINPDGSNTDVIMSPHAPAPFMRMAQTPQGWQPVGKDNADLVNADQHRPDVRIIFNPTMGTYGIEADVGPSYGTQRQEAANAFVQIMTQNPAAFTVVGDLWADNSDFPGAEVLAERLRRGLPQQYKPGPDPQVQQVTAQAQQMMQQGQQLMQKADAEIARLNAEIVRLKEQKLDRMGELEIDTYKAETDRMKVAAQVDPAAMQLVVRQLVRDMLMTDIVPMLREHATLEGQLQASMDPSINTPQGAMLGPQGQPPPIVQPQQGASP